VVLARLLFTEIVSVIISFRSSVVYLGSLHRGCDCRLCWRKYLYSITAAYFSLNVLFAVA